MHVLGGEGELEGEGLAHGVLRKGQKEEPAVSIGAVVDVVLEVKSEIPMVLGLNFDPRIIILLLSFLCLDYLLLCSDYKTERHSQEILEEGRVCITLSSGFEYKPIVSDDKLSL